MFLTSYANCKDLDHTVYKQNPHQAVVYRFSINANHCVLRKFATDSLHWYLKVMAMYKLNNFHFHLTDDEGWRIQISDYPELTTIGGKRCDAQRVDWTLIYVANRDYALEGQPNALSKRSSKFFLQRKKRSVFCFRSSDAFHMKIINSFYSSLLYVQRR